MCRLYGFTSNEQTKVECTLVQSQNALLLQSRGDRAGTTHSDGWGIGFYENGEPRVEKRTAAAFDDIHFSTTAERVFARTIIAHVRKATVGRLSLANTHPFTVGPWVFAHNGTLQGFGQIEPILLDQTSPALRTRRKGQTDSELMFLWLLSRLERAGIEIQAGEHGSQLGLIIDQLAESLLILAEMSSRSDAGKTPRLNCLLTDGSVLLAARFNHTLYYVQRQGVHDCEICGIPHIHHGQGKEYRAVVVASEPLSAEPWQEIPNYSVLGIDNQQGTILRQMPQPLRSAAQRLAGAPLTHDD